MQWIGEVLRRLAFFFRRGQFQRDLKEEMERARADEGKDLTDEGMLPDDARDTASRNPLEVR
jgi:hypothetical protein